MDSRETLALYQQGKEAWNEWAREMSARRNENDPQWEQAATAFFSSQLREEFREVNKKNSGEANFSGFLFPGLVGFWGADHIVRFDGARFEGWATFTNARFPDQVTFKDAVFHKWAMFNCVRFEGLTRFDGATFRQEVSFESTVFNERTMIQNPEVSFSGVRFDKGAKFTKAHFHSRTSFNRAVFNDLTDFSASVFEGKTTFTGTKCQGQADFRAIKSTSVFLFDDLGPASQDWDSGMAEFSTVPDFQQATFVEAPRLDNVKIGPQLSRWNKLKAFFTKGDLEKEGRWRALKRLATQGHDHASEQLFFREELLARRGVTDRYWHASFWLGVFYQIFSDFGRSLIRPLLWWATGTLVFAAIYVGYHPSGGEWFLLECVAGTGKPWISALGLSLHRSLPALSGFGDTLPQFQACLYGVQSENPFRPVIPDGVSFLGIPQVLFSAVMIFLFLLAVRNHFRIK